MSLQIVGEIQFPYSKRFPRLYQIIWSFFPPNLFTKAIWLLADATSTPQDIGISWSRQGECAPNDEECVITIVCEKIQALTPKFLQ